MKISSAMRLASDCVRHVLKEDYGEMKYPKYVREERQQILQQRIKSLTKTLEILYEIEIMNAQNSEGG